MIENYWSWLIDKPGRQVGYKLLLTRWLILDFAISILLTFFLKVDGFEFASKALMPSASILAGMSFAWTTRASSILNNKDFRDKIIGVDNPLEDYVYGFQMSIMILFGCVICIAIMAVGGFDFYIYEESVSRNASSFLLFLLISLTIRECWSVINFTSLLTMLEDRVKK